MKLVTMNRLIISALVSSTLVGGALGQDQEPEYMAPRGLTATGTYTLSKTETIDTVSGNVIYKIPIASMPRGRGGSSWDVSLGYNSSIYDMKPPQTGTSPGHNNEPTIIHDLQASPWGGWQYGYQFGLDEEMNTLETCTGLNSNISGNVTWFRLSAVFPDRSHHILQLYGQSSLFGDGFFQVDPTSGNFACQTSSPLTSPLTYYTTDGTFVRVSVSFPNLSWTMTLHDGTVVSGVGPQTNSITDRNGNVLTITRTLNTHTGVTTTVLSDALNRAITLQTGSSSLQDTITQTGFGPTANAQPTLTWTIMWRNLTASSLSYQYDSEGDRTTVQPPISIDNVVLPSTDGSTQKFQFTYDCDNSQQGWGELNSVTFPSAAKALYTYYNLLNPINGFLNNPVETKEVDWTEQQDGGTSPVADKWSFGRTQSGNATVPSYVVTTNPDGGQVKSYFLDPQMAAANPSRGLVFQTIQPDGSTVERIWQHNYPFEIAGADPANPYVQTEVHSVATNGAATQAAATQYQYDQNGNVLQTSEYDFFAFTSTSGQPPNISNLPSTATRSRVMVPKVSTPAAAGSAPADNTSAYWNPKAPVLINLVGRTTTTGVGVTHISERDYDGNGNTKETRDWDSTKGTATTPLSSARSGGNAAVRDYGYDSYGNLTSYTDPINTATAYTYDSNSLYVIKKVLGSGTTIAETTTYQYDPSCTSNRTVPCMGLVTQQTDPNGNVRNTSYDELGRPVSVIDQTSGGTTLHELQTQYEDGNLRLVTKNDLSSGGDGLLVHVTDYDQLGRVRLVRDLETSGQNPDADTDGIKTQTRYRYITGGSMVLTSNPYRASTSSGASGESTMGWVLTTKDTNGRTKGVTYFGGAGIPNTFPITISSYGPNGNVSGSVSTTYASQAQTTTENGQPNITRTTTVDGLGRLIQVADATGTTSYGYDVGNNLIGVTQGTPSLCADVQGTTRSRCFAYDSLNRLSSATNPESGTTSYAYDSGGNLVTKTDARSTVSSLAYDALSRIIQKSYTGGSPTVATPTTNLCYDGQTTATSYTGTQYTCTGATALSNANAIGRLTWEGNSNSATSFTLFDGLGHVLNSAQTTVVSSKSYPYPFSYTYNAAGLMTSETYPSTRSVSLTYDGAGRVSTIGGTKSYTSAAIQYTAHDAVTAIPLAVNSLVEQRCYNSRLQPFTIRLGAGTTTNCANSGTDALNLLFTYGATQDGTGNVTSNDDDGNILSQQIARSGQTTLTQTYGSYDGVSRLVSASESGGTSEWSQNYGYDIFGNRWVSSGTNLSSFTPAAQTNFNSANQLLIQGSGYDNSGNQKAIGSYSFLYDAENRQTSVTIGSSTAGTYGYDAEGRRVTKLSGGATRVYVYDVLGQLAAEYYSGNPQDTLCQPCYVTMDQLGSTRAETDGTSGQVVACHDYLPFGEEIPSGTGGRTASCFAASDALVQRFTAKERDTETASSAMQGLDFFGARHFSGAQGRFTSPDWSARPQPIPYADLKHPQTLNLYAYVLNNPMAIRDFDGHCGAIGGWCAELVNWAIGRTAVTGPKQFAQDLGIGVAKGAGSFALNTVKGLVALSQNPGAAAATMLTPGPQALAPSNTTQAQVSVATQLTLTAGSILTSVGSAAAATTTATAAESAATTSFVFYSGPGAQTAAEAWSAANNGTMIGMTQFGQAIENGTMTVEAASEAFANSASGTAQVFSNDPLTNYGNIWYNYELPALADNPNVTNVVFNPVPKVP